MSTALELLPGTVSKRSAAVAPRGVIVNNGQERGSWAAVESTACRRDGRLKFLQAAGAEQIIRRADPDLSGRGAAPRCWTAR